MPDLKKYEGWALITGASAGIGREYARQIAASGVNCVLVARRGDRLIELADELRADHGVDCRPVEQDLAARDAVTRLTEATNDIPIGLLVNNAGYGDAGEFATRDPDRVAAMIAVNCAAPVLLARAFVPRMIERKRGAVIMVSSVLGLIPAPYETVYGATKAFDLSFGEGLWYELRGTGVDVITMCPATTRTEFLLVQGFSDEKMRRVYRVSDSPERIAALTLKKLGRKTVTGPWSTAVVSVLSRFAPRRILTLTSGAIMRSQMLE